MAIMAKFFTPEGKLISGFPFDRRNEKAQQTQSPYESEITSIVANSLVPNQRLVRLFRCETIHLGLIQS